jgi:nitrogenase molybdenum-iron protein NifN
VSRSYKPAAIGVTSTCLSETIGEDVLRYLRQYEKERQEGRRNHGDAAPMLFYVSTASYRGTHVDGFHEAIWAAVSTLAGRDQPSGTASLSTRVNLISGFVSPEDLRELHGILGSFGIAYTLLPDYSETLDGPSWETYQKLPAGGTKIADIQVMGEAAGTLYLGYPPGKNGGAWLAEHRAVPLIHRDLPIGIANTDLFFQALEELSGRETPEVWTKQRGRLIDAYIDGHKYCSGKRAIIYGEEDLVAALASFLDEIGVIPVIAATGAERPGFRMRIQAALRNTREETEVMDDADFIAILERARDAGADFVMGHSKGLYLSRELGIPLVRCGFPIHDRIGGQRILHLGYRGTMNLFDLIGNTLLQAKQDRVSKGYTYL